MITIPYDRAAVKSILAADGDPDDKRRLLHAVIRQFDAQVERENIARVTKAARDNGEMLIFGRMSRAFHNQGLLFANAGFVRVTAPMRARIAEIAAACAVSPRLLPPADRLRLLLDETALTAALGALEALETAILDDQRLALDTLLAAERDGISYSGPSCGELLARTDRLLECCRALRGLLMAAPLRPAAMVILSQRASETGSHLIARINEGQEPYLGKAENLRVLARRAGSRLYASPEYAWLRHADHWVEAIPLFIKERVLVVDGTEITETVIDQQAMEESFREDLADHWAHNIEHVIDSEHVDLARTVSPDAAPDEIGRLAARIARAYAEHAEEIHQQAERDGVARYDALRAWLRDGGLASSVAITDEQTDTLAVRLATLAHLPRRPLPVLHVLTTQSARMTDGYIRTWLEESMALYNVVRAHGLEEDVRTRMAAYRADIARIGARVIHELGMWAEVEEVMAAEDISEERAVSRLIAGNAAIARQVSLIAVLAEGDGMPSETDPLVVEEVLLAQAEALRCQAIQAVYERNNLDLFAPVEAYRRQHAGVDEADAAHAVIADNAAYADDVATFTRFAAREAAIRVLDSRDPARSLASCVRDWLRDHTRLAKTTARRETLLAHGLNHLTLHPLYDYRATGGKKRFHLLYTPSRVDLGARERESVESWAQWVGGADREAARVGRRLYGLINKQVKMFESLTEPEVLKTGENAAMVANFSYANAMSLLVNAVGRGDIEELGDQMSLRKDRLILPGGEGYGGYCVPKDGLFLEFVLILTRSVKLRQLGVADHLHAGVIALATALLARREEFALELEWEAWAMQRLADRQELAAFFSLRATENGPIPVFQITRIAQALTRLGRPELTDAFDVLANLTARWGVHKIIVGGEQVNRFMPFYKTWLTYQAVAEAARRNPGIAVRTRDFTAVLTAEYKPDTQDGRFSVGMRKFEIFAGTAEHLTYALDVPGQDLVHLMFRGFADLWEGRDDPRRRARLTRLLRELQVGDTDATAIARLRALYPGYAPPAEVRMVSPMGLSTSDLLHYTSDTPLDGLAQETLHRLLHAGFSEQEITANMLVYGPCLARWTGRLSAEARQALRDTLGGGLHALALRMRGPLGNYELALQGADVLDTGIPHRALLALLANPVTVRDLMLEGNPHSALTIVDGASGARPRALNRLAVMRWFAAGEAIGRQTIYRAIGLGADTVESWRLEMRRQRARARVLYDALLTGNLTTTRDAYQTILTDLREELEAALTLEGEERLLRGKKTTAQETATARALAAIAAGLPLEALDFATWLALGGQFLTMGYAVERLAEMRAAYEQAMCDLFGQAPAADDAVTALLHCPAYIPAAAEFHEEKGVESSNKATEEVAAIALDTRQRLAARAARARALHEREAACSAELDAAAALPLPQLLAAARAARGDGATITQAHFGQLQALTRLSFLALGRKLFAATPELQAALAQHVAALCNGRDWDSLALRAISGGYEDLGDLARLAQTVAEAFRAGEISEAARDEHLAQVADVAELLDCCCAIAATVDFFTVPTPALQVWQALAAYFAESLNDHRYEYRPWAYSRGLGFQHLQGDALYTLAVQHHRWQYRYLRRVALTLTALGERSPEELEALLGDMRTAAERPAIGADGASSGERQWRAYSQLRELAFIRNDGFPLPEVFPAFDPALIDAETRTNALFLYPLGRTHVSRALTEGPTLARELAAQGKPGLNVLITRDARVVTLPGLTRPVLQVTDAHLYISREEYLRALRQHRGLTPAEAEALATRHVGPHGVRIAARFTTPVTVALVVPFHGHPKYEGGLLEELGLPYTSQSLFHTWTTYDKAKYPAIFTADTGVDIPGEIDWLAQDTAVLGEDATRRAIMDGDATGRFPGLRRFAARFALVMVKDAAESGGRGQKAFALRGPDSALDARAIAYAVDFIYQISLTHNVAVQEVIISSPEYWATEAFMQSFVDRQIQEHGAIVNRRTRPRTNIYGSHRLIFSSPDPRSGVWHVSHPITLNSRQLITNVGRGGTLELFLPEVIRPEFRDLLLQRMREAGERCMLALARYGDTHGAAYMREMGRAIGADATGLSYATPRYMMLDFLVQPLFAEAGLLVDLAPRYDADGNRRGVDFILQQGIARITGTVRDWRVVLIEPNIGIGLWDRVALREAAQHGDVGANARIVLRDLAQAGEDYLKAIGK